MRPQRTVPLILVVDDQPEITDILARQLTRWGYEAECANSGREALDLAASHQPDLILLDVQMPGMTGFEALPRIRAQPDLSLTPIVILTGLDSPSDHAQGIRLGADDYLTKPVDPVLLKARVTSLMTRERLRHEAEQIRRDFTAMIVHDLRNPLTIIQGFAELLLDDQEALGSDFARKSVPRIIENAQKALTLAAQMLDLSQLDSGQLQLALERRDLSAYLQDIAGEQALLAEQKHVGLHVDIQPGLQASVDPVKFSEAIVNLLGNAIKFTPAGGQVSLKAANGSSAIEISVSDTGPGISRDAQQRLFRPWATYRRPTSLAKGYGLGLAIARMVVEAHGGALSVDSEPGRGATFKFSIPSLLSHDPVAS